ncbi:MAG: prepilin-type N-terminal cleavage/methylation domain-containing protein, partial [Anaerolineae bacterium]
MPARGFTLTELVIILVLVGVLAVFVVPRLNVTGF